MKTISERSLIGHGDSVIIKERQTAVADLQNGWNRAEASHVHRKVCMGLFYRIGNFVSIR